MTVSAQSAAKAEVTDWGKLGLSFPSRVSRVRRWQKRDVRLFWRIARPLMTFSLIKLALYEPETNWLVPSYDTADTLSCTCCWKPCA